MKKAKLLVGLLALTAAALFPLSSASKSAAKGDTVTLSKSNTLILAGVVDGKTAASVINGVRDLDADKSASKKPIYLFLSTPGGSIQAGLDIIEALKGSERQVNTITSFAASMGFQIAQNLGDRLILKSGTLMSHRASGGFEGEFGGQKPSQIDSRYSFWLDRLNEMDEQTVLRTKGKQTLESYQKQYASEMWLTGTKAVDQGYADKAVTVKCDETLVGATTHTINFLGMEINYDLDNCPLNSTPMNIHVAGVYTAEYQGRVAKLFLEDYAQKMHNVVRNYGVF